MKLLLSKTVLLVGFSILVIIGISLLVQPRASSEINIGVIGPLSGQGAFFGEGLKKGAELALSERNGLRNKYKLIFEDDQMNPEHTKTSIVKLTSLDKVSAVISFTSGPGNVVSPIAQKQSIIHFAIGSDLLLAKGTYNFNHWTLPETENQKFVEEAEKRDYKKLGILTLNQSGTIAVTESLKRLVEQRHDFQIFTEVFSPGTKDFRASILKLQQKQPDAYVLLSFSPELELIGKTLKEMGINKPVTSIEAFDYTTEPGLFSGNWYISTAHESDWFWKRYTDRFGKPPSPGSGNIYDIINLLIDGFEMEGSDTNKVSSFLQEIREYQGAMGDSLFIDADGNIISEASVKVVP